MCGRYRLKDPKRAFEDLGYPEFSDIGPRYNISPTQRVLILNSKREPEQVTWGFVPVWAKDSLKAIINARCESVREKRSFKSSFQQRRCLAPADGFYEWTKIGKRPHFFTVNGGVPFAIAGIWDKGQDNSRCCLLTTAANAVLEPIHNRMPVIVRREDWDEWFSPDPLSDASFRRITTPYAPEEMAALEVSPLVNSGRVDDARCCEPLGSVVVDVPPLKIKRKEPVQQDNQQMFGF